MILWQSWLSHMHTTCNMRRAASTSPHLWWYWLSYCRIFSWCPTSSRTSCHPHCCRTHGGSLVTSFEPSFFKPSRSFIMPAQQQFLQALSCSCLPHIRNLKSTGVLEFRALGTSNVTVLALCNTPCERIWPLCQWLCLFGDTDPASPIAHSNSCVSN